MSSNRPGIERNTRYYKLICENLKELLKYRDLTYKEMASMLKMSTSHFDGKINGFGRFTLLEVKMIANILKVTTDEILGA